MQIELRQLLRPLAFCLAALPTACASVAPFGRAPPQCSSAEIADRPAPATHGPGATGEPIELVAVRRPPGSSLVPLLYVFNDQAQHLMPGMELSSLLADPAFIQAEKEAFWGEVVDGHYYTVPWLDRCSQASMVVEPLSFRAPPGGLLFMQYLAPDCDQCDQITAAVRSVIAANPQLPLRWVRVSVPPSVAGIRRHTRS